MTRHLYAAARCFAAALALQGCATLPVELADHLTGHFVVPSRPLRSYLMCDHFAGGEEGTMRWSISLSSASFVLINPHTGAHVAQRNR